MSSKYLDTADQQISVIVRSRKGRLFEGAVRAVTSYNDAGEFDVLPLHENFISLIKRHLKIFPKTGEAINIPLQIGVLKVNSGKVDVYIGIAD